MSNVTYDELLKNKGFRSFLWTQFLGAFNDSVFKMFVSMTAVSMAATIIAWLKQMPKSRPSDLPDAASISGTTTPSVVPGGTLQRRITQW